MVLRKSSRDVFYPESDGKPMGETDLHRDWMVRILEWMRERYRGQRVYCTSDVLLYYEEGNPRKVIVPDNFVVFDSDPGRRRIYKLWEEGKPPSVVVEVTSSKSRLRDTRDKPRIYAAIGVPEYFVYDPTSDYLRPPLRGFRLANGGYELIEADANGALRSEALQVTVALEGTELVMHDMATGERLCTGAEVEAERRRHAERARRESERARRESERARRESERARRQAERERHETEQARQQLERRWQQSEVARERAERERDQAAARMAELEAELRRRRGE